MLKFYEQIIGDLLEDSSGGLVILSGGLGLFKLISYLLHLHDPSQGSLLILSASPSQKSSILRNYQDTLNLETPISTSEITFDLPAPQRLSLYGSGGIFFITARILIVDLLTHRLPTTAVAGIILLNAHSLSDTSTEAFIVRILRSSNRSLYVRAFSDRPHAMVSGFAKAERTLKCLFLRKLHLWPRFQVHVSQDLERDPPEVVDIRVPMSPYMIGIQKAVIEVMDACLKEMRKTNKVDVEDLTVENGLFKSFDEIVRRQLDPIWHTLGKKTKQLVSDLKTLRKLLDYLARYDAVTYLKYLDSLRASESFRSVWIFSESSYKIFEYAKKRVYHFGRSDGGKSLVPSKTLSTKKRKLEKNKSEDDSSARANSGLVLEEVLEEPPKWKVLREILEEIQEEREKQVSSREELIHEGETEYNGMVLVACKDERSCMQLEDCITKGTQKVSKTLSCFCAFFDELSAIFEFAIWGILVVILTTSGRVRGGGWMGCVEGNEGSSVMCGSYGLGSGASCGEADFCRFIDFIFIWVPFGNGEGGNGGGGGCGFGGSGLILKCEILSEFLTYFYDSVIYCYRLDNYQDAHLPEVNSSLEPQSTTAQNLITRKAGGKKEAEKEMQVIVDMREFMSSLPNVLHQKGMRIIPVTLEVGDYILSPLICVERKSIQDLFGSFSSGRLYHQVEMMSRYYRIPVLLIEFSQDKSFSFLSASDIGDDVSPNSIISKLSLLVLHFPRLRILWSRSLHATAEIFTTLKANQDEPDEARAIRVGVPSEEGIVENDVRAENFNTSAVEFLRRLPGVTDSNYRSIMEECKSLAELALLPVERLAEVMGGLKAAKTLRDFLDAKYPTLL
ncbi:DNA repair endonuclease UVH1 [Olea europaea var. sylvestris]|uniref:DNA repair endonuclease UVH1 n=1 Tax=Olea europaea var. sylvestris TaxID=158386 RepID=UPI000C1D2EA7|nr:DNA repair endonuclease UVH1 [Olea europaea var. sylvestris]